MKLTPIDGDLCRLTARISDIDAALRRVFPLRWLLESVQTSTLALARPTSWEDPREDLATLCMMDGFGLTPRRPQQSLEAYLAPVWAQCWSRNAGSDTLLRAYSTVKIDSQTQRNGLRETEGVTVTTTPRRLLAAAEIWNANGEDVHVVVGGVDYLEDKDIQQRFANICNGQDGPLFFRSVQGRADSLLWKRSYFAHEEEVRLLAIARARPQGEKLPPMRKFPIRPDELFTSISFDPRLAIFERLEREAEVRAAGYSGQIIEDGSYQKVALQILMIRDWPPP